MLILYIFFVHTIKLTTYFIFYSLKYFVYIHFCIFNKPCLLNFYNFWEFILGLFVCWFLVFCNFISNYVQSFFVFSFLDSINRDMAFLDGTMCLIAAVFHLTFFLTMTFCLLYIPFVLPCLSRPSNMATTILPFSSSSHRNKLTFTSFLSVDWGKSICFSTQLVWAECNDQTNDSMQPLDYM